jgi:hypothetical protein
MLIHNYGLFWELADVFWGRPKVEGHLKGVLADSLRSPPVNFREQQGIYVLYDENFRLVYVGQTGAGNRRLFARIGDHTSDNLAKRWSRFSWFGTRWVKGNGELAKEVARFNPPIASVLDHIEAILITAAEPVHNRQGGRFGKEVHQYLQFRDRQALGPSNEQMIREVWMGSKQPQI